MTTDFTDLEMGKTIYSSEASPNGGVAGSSMTEMSVIEGARRTDKYN